MVELGLAGVSHQLGAWKMSRWDFIFWFLVVAAMSMGLVSLAMGVKRRPQVTAQGVMICDTVNFDMLAHHVVCQSKGKPDRVVAVIR